MEGVTYAAAVAEFDLDRENCGAAVKVVDRDGHQWIELVIDNSFAYALTPEDTRNMARAFQQARMRII